MSSIFIKLYMDENVPVVVAKILRSKGHDVLTTDEAANKGLDDRRQLEFAVENERALVTINRVDFEELAREYFYRNISHAGIFISPDVGSGEIANRLSRYLDIITADEMSGQVIYI